MAGKPITMSKVKQIIRLRNNGTALRQWTSTRGATMHFEHQPGDKLFIDFAGKKLQWIDRSSGEIHNAEVYIAILGCSNLVFLCQNSV